MCTGIKTKRLDQFSDMSNVCGQIKIADVESFNLVRYVDKTCFVHIERINPHPPDYHS